MPTLLCLFPFLALLLSIAFVPLFFPHFWKKYYGAVAGVWALVSLGCGYLLKGDWQEVLVAQALVPLGGEFLPFMLLVSGLYVITGGVTIKLRVQAGPVTNTLFLAVFTVLAGVLGTTGAAMLGIRPLLEMNQGRRYMVHTAVFFIFLVCNVGGILSAVGDPPLFIGFLKGIPFFWPTQNLGGSFVWIGTYLLVLYALLETLLWRREGSPSPVTPSFPLLKWVTIRGKSHLILAAGLIGMLILTAHVKMGDWKIDLWSVGKVGLPLGDLVRHGSVLLLMGLSLVLKPLSQRAKEHWHLHPLGEIALLFCAIFITAEPVIHLLQAAGGGQAFGVFSALKSPSLDQAFLYFWLTGVLSSFLDNAPTYLVFFSLAGGDPALLTGSLRIILVAISTGAVFMGALTYIGNAPNLLVKAIAEEEYGVAMPHFLAYIFWACLALIPPLAFWSVWTFGFPA